MFLLFCNSRRFKAFRLKAIFEFQFGLSKYKLLTNLTLLALLFDPRGNFSIASVPTPAK